jgi:hypothetical protein
MTLGRVDLRKFEMELGHFREQNLGGYQGKVEHFN